MKPEGGIVFLTADEMAEFDRRAIQDVGIDETVLMENAGVAVARVARLMLGGEVEGKTVSFLIGKGNNGGDGLVAARHLRNWGARVNLLLCGDRRELRDIPGKQLAILERMGVGASGPESDVGGASLLVDALLGYNLKGDPREPLAGLIRRANSSKVMVLAVDIPSGLDATSGEPGDPCVIANATVTLGLPKTGFLNPEARSYLGDLYLADLSFPGVLYASYSQKKVLFGKDTVVRVW